MDKEWKGKERKGWTTIEMYFMSEYCYLTFTLVRCLFQIRTGGEVWSGGEAKQQCRAGIYPFVFRLCF